MKQFSFLILFIPFLLRAQPQGEISISVINNQGVKFVELMSWKKVLEKAKMEHKFIFVDCYTTWCGPCKKMEMEVYPEKKVGDLYNEKFISVKMQMDTSKRDNELIKSSYTDAHNINKQYKINAYPTFLFFTPDGNILNKAMGALGADDFIRLANQTIDPKRDYYNLLADYQQGKRDVTEMRYLTHTAIQLLDDTTLAKEIAAQYIGSLKKDQWVTRNNIEFIREFTKKSNDIGFNFFYHNTDTIDKVMEENGYSEKLLQSIIYKEMAAQEMSNTGVAPDWNAIQSTISRKYNDYYAERVIIVAKSTWGFQKKDWAQYSKYTVMYVEKYWPFSNGPVQALLVNNFAWAIFLHSNNVDELNKALLWSNRAIMMSPEAGWMDTYANILYKLGQKQLAITWEEVVVKLAPDDKEFLTTLTKMKNGEPTWN